MFSNVDLKGACHHRLMKDKHPHRKALVCAFSVQAFLMMGFSMSGCAPQNEVLLNAISTGEAVDGAHESTGQTSQDTPSKSTQKGAHQGSGEDFITLLATTSVDGAPPPSKSDIFKPHYSTEAPPFAPPETPLWQEGLDLLVKTAKDITVGQDGLFPSKGQMKIEVVKPLAMGSYEDGRAPLDLRPKDAVINPKALSNPSPTEVPITKGQTIQLGSFSSAYSAQKAWKQFLLNHPELKVYQPVYQVIATDSGERVRLKLGPLGPKTASVLCESLASQDPWCLKSGV